MKNIMFRICRLLSKYNMLKLIQHLSIKNQNNNGVHHICGMNNTINIQF